jgi:23S rRNA (uracil1939-C5)-methyltransferase
LESLIQLTIEKLSFGGEGIARHDGLVYFVSGVAPGDVIQAIITEKKKNFARAKVKTWISKSTSHVTPPCKYYESCGGCLWQNIDYQTQLQQKEIIVLENLKKASKESFAWLGVTESPKVFNYRNRIQLKVENGRVGYFGKGTHSLIEIDSCLIAEEKLSAHIQKLKNDPKVKRQKALSRVELRLDSAENIVENWDYSLDEPTAFAQVNRWLNPELVKETLTWADGKYDRIIDLYAGSGNFTFPLYEKLLLPSLAVELNPGAVAIAREHIKLKNLKNLEFLKGDVEAVIRRILPTPSTLLVLDPPRAGASENVIQYIADLKPTKILYISCNPTTLQRDILRLSSAAGYRLTRAKSFDMFPHTHHIETLVELTLTQK